MYKFDFREATITHDYERRIVEFYFTRASNYEACKKRNPSYILAEDLNPGYRLLYPFNQCRTPEYLLRTQQGLADNPNKVVNSSDSETGKAR